MKKDEEIVKIIKRIPLKPETIKTLKIMAINLDLDNDGTIKPEMLGECIDKVVEDFSNAYNTDNIT